MEKLKGIPSSATKLMERLITFEADEGEYDILFIEPLLGEATDDYQSLNDKEKLIEILWCTAYDPETRERLFTKASLDQYPPRTLREWCKHATWLYLGMLDPEDSAKKK